MGIMWHPNAPSDALWVETDLSGRELGRWPLDHDAYPVVLSGDDTAYTELRRGRALLRLDRTLGKWIPAGIPMPPGAFLLAAEKTDLVFVQRDGGRTVVSWVAAQNH